MKTPDSAQMRSARILDQTPEQNFSHQLARTCIGFGEVIRVVQLDVREKAAGLHLFAHLVLLQL